MRTSIAYLLRTPMLRLVLALGLTSCFASSTSATDLSGHWSGQWISCTSGHKGPLQADFCKICETKYRVTFTGRFFVVFPFRYQVTLNVVSDDGEHVTLSGTSYLGRIYGTFRYNATATCTDFVSRYDSCKDDGKFVLHRCCNDCR